MKRVFIMMICFVSIAVTTSSCKKHKGCMDIKALNKDFDAEKDDGSCRYSTVVFYMSVLDPTRPVTLSVNGNTIGTITAYYPGGPGNCSAPGCAIFQFKSSEQLDWVATEPGGTIWTGTIEPNSSSECIKVRVF